jgi:hypothetical protein
MAVRSDITAAHEWFAGEDKELHFTVLDADGNPVDPTGWALEWALRRRAPDADPALISKTTSSGISLSGVYNANPSLNTQRVVVAIADTDTDALSAATYKHGLKRTDAGNESVLTFGDAVLQVSAAH